MMFDRLLNFLQRRRETIQPAVIDCDEDSSKERERTEIDRRIQAAQRMNDAFDGIVETLTEGGHKR